MNLTKNQFYATWIIFGFAIYYGFHQTLICIGELLVNMAIHLNADPMMVKYSKLSVYTIVTIVLIIVSINIINNKNRDEIIFKPKKLRIFLVCIVATGMISQVSTLFIRKQQMRILVEYLNNHNMRISDFYTDYSTVQSFPNILLFLSAIVIFFFLTRDKVLKQE